VTGSYSWTIPDAPSTNCLVRICDASDSDPCDQSNAVFTILGVPTDPTGCMASDGLCDKVVFCWADISDNETGFYIYRDGSKIDSLGADATCYDDLGAAPGMTYNYCVTAYNDCGESGQCCDNGTRQVGPAAPTACAASDDLCDMVQFCWTDNSDNETGFYIYRDAAKLDSVGADVTCYDDISAAPGMTYEYCVSAYNDCGESSQCCDNGTVATETLELTSPDGGEDWEAGTTQSIVWTCSCLDSVKLEYSTDGGATWIFIASGLPCAKGSYPWTVPNTPSGNCLVRALDAFDGQPSDGSDATFTITPPSEVIYVDLDIRPGSCPNPLNTRGYGVLSVAILGTDVFDVNDVDPGTVMLEGVSPLKWSWKDVGTPMDPGSEPCECNEYGSDGFTDMTLKFETQEIVDALDSQAPLVDGETRVLTITGMTYGGVPLEGTDCVIIIRKGQPRSPSGQIAGYTLGKNYPNPFNPDTDISFTLPERTYVTLTIYNVVGKKVRTLVSGEMDGGTHFVRWNGTDENGSRVASGIYFYRLKTQVFDQTMKMVLMK
jgi:hypothetical protein